MPFSWKKKTSCTRFSQLVADRLQSPKRGGSLVVETGFPTSLIDLYVRNRGRFCKSSAKKQKGNDSLPSSSSSSSSSDSSAGLNNLSSVASDYWGSGEIIEEDVFGGMVGSDRKMEIANSSKTEEERNVEMAKSNPLLVAALKVLVVVVLALGTKWFTVGITVSAFLLFFLELVGKPLLGRWSLIRPGVDSKTLFESSFHTTKNITSYKENTTLVCSEVLEIEEQVDSKQEVRLKEELDEAKCEVFMEIRHKSSRRAMMKSRMKKLVPKKLRTSKKSSMDSGGETSHRFKEEDTVRQDQDLKPLVLSSECLESKGETLCVSKQEQDNIVGIERRSSSSSTVLGEIDGNDKEVGRETQQSSGYLVLCLIVLVGLIGGRVLALVLALSWCLMLKKSQWRNVKFSIS